MENPSIHYRSPEFLKCLQQYITTFEAIKNNHSVELVYLEYKVENATCDVTYNLDVSKWVFERISSASKSFVTFEQVD